VWEDIPLRLAFALSSCSAVSISVVAAPLSAAFCSRSSSSSSSLNMLSMSWGSQVARRGLPVSSTRLLRLLESIDASRVDVLRSKIPSKVSLRLAMPELIVVLLFCELFLLLRNAGKFSSSWIEKQVSSAISFRISDKSAEFPPPFKTELGSCPLIAGARNT
jgi:hypothetical protein